MDNDAVPLEELWDSILSRHSRVIRRAYNSLPPADQAIILAHLNRMASEPDWQPEQRTSARAALKAIHTGQDLLK